MECRIPSIGRRRDTKRVSTGFESTKDSGASVRAFPRDFAEDAVRNGAQYETVTGEFARGHGGARISGRVYGGPLHRTSRRMVGVHKTLMPFTPLEEHLSVSTSVDPLVVLHSMTKTSREVQSAPLSSPIGCRSLQEDGKDQHTGKTTRRALNQMGLSKFN